MSFLYARLAQWRAKWAYYQPLFSPSYHPPRQRLFVFAVVILVALAMLAGVSWGPLMDYYNKFGDIIPESPPEGGADLFAIPGPESLVAGPPTLSFRGLSCTLPPNYMIMLKISRRQSKKRHQIYHDVDNSGMEYVLLFVVLCLAKASNHQQITS